MKPRIGPRNDPRGRVDGFDDINRLALDNKYEKTAAPLSKRRNGMGPAGRNDPFFFGAAPLSKRRNGVGPSTNDPVFFGSLYPGQIRTLGDAAKATPIWNKPDLIPWIAGAAFLYWASR